MPKDGGSTIQDVIFSVIALNWLSKCMHDVHWVPFLFYGSCSKMVMILNGGSDYHTRFNCCQFVGNTTFFSEVSRQAIVGK